MRKPGGVSFESFVDQQIREAEERGAFTNLPGKGRPLPDVDRHDEAWWIKRKMADEGLSLPLPPGLQVRRDVERFREKLGSLPSEARVREEVEALNAQIRKVNATLIEGPASGVMPLPVDEVIATWRGTRRVAGR